MNEYQLWTLTETGEMDRRIATDLDDWEDAAEMAQAEANKRDSTIVLMRNGEGMEIFYPEDQP